MLWLMGIFGKLSLWLIIEGCEYKGYDLLAKALNIGGVSHWIFLIREVREGECGNDVHTVCSLSKVKMQMPALLV